MNDYFDARTSATPRLEGARPDVSNRLTRELLRRRGRSRTDLKKEHPWPETNDSVKQRQNFIGGGKNFGKKGERWAGENKALKGVNKCGSGPQAGRT